MSYDEQILYILSEVGDRGISVQHLSMHVYNMNNGLFSSVTTDEVYRYVQQYLLKNSKSANPIVENAGKRGRYRLNKNRLPEQCRQLMISFADDYASSDESGDDGEEKKEQDKDYSLSLFE